MDRKKMLAMTARMEGREVVAANIGDKVTVSEMELIALVNFAEVGLMSLFAAIGGKTGEDAEQSLNAHLDAIRASFGLEPLTATAAALVRGEKFGKYMVSTPE